LTVEAEVIVIGEPVALDGKTLPLKYRIVKVLKGPEALAKQEITLDNDGEVYSFSPPYDEDKPKPLPTITRALLFLENPKEGGARYLPVLSGIRALTKADGLLVPTQSMNPGPQHLVKVEGPTGTQCSLRCRKICRRLPSCAS
jgi:hypothetical protein